ncbi:unnamed protein product [Miscanthus lutarioriparius]|uniref:DUF7595 domain-containing protein n=1 Tax=Miscanthus lutarioriparius TaxID=422564 RepID=A0A811N7B8_9POAL|nr:unnamed protein product [Miscanthus lutarioriparius]
MHQVDVTEPGTEATARLLSAAEGFPPNPDGKVIMWHRPLAWRDGLFLVRTTDLPRRYDELRVCDPATGCSQTLPLEPTFPGDAEKCWQPPWAAQKRWQPYVLLGDDGGGGGIRPFQVIKTNLVMSEHHRYLETQTFSSESGTWGTYAKLLAPYFHGSSLLRGGLPLVVGGAVHWLCVTDAASYVLMLNIRTTPAQVSVTTLPVSFPRPNNKVSLDYLLATATAGGSMMVLVADGDKISAWVQTATKPTAKWKPRPEVVVEYEALLRFRNVAWPGSFHVRLHWFDERSGFVLVYVGFTYGYFWLDLRSKKIVRCFSDPRLTATSVLVV